MEDTISEVMRSLPPGSRFHATDEELLLLYLKPKILGQPEEHYSNIIPEIDVCEFEPWQLPAMFDHLFNRKELFFYCCVKRTYVNSRRPNRMTRAGYWKGTGKERAIMSKDTNEQIGIKKTMVFYEGREPKGKRNNWVMHEYCLNSELLGDNRDEGETLPYVACRIKNIKDNKPMIGCAPTISPEGYSEDLPSFCNKPNNGVAHNQEALEAQPEQSMRELMESLTLDDSVSDNNNNNNAPTYQPQAAVYSQPEMSLKELMNSLPPLETLDDYASNCISTPTHPPQAGAEAGSSPLFDCRYLPCPCSDFDFGWCNV